MKRMTLAIMAVMTVLTLWSAGCFKALPESIYKCSYTYDQVTGCGQMGTPITTKNTATETVTATDPTHACVLIAEYTFMDYPGRIHLICDPSTCENLGPAPTMPGLNPQGLGGSGPAADAGPVIVCDGGAMSACPALDYTGAFTPCFDCFVASPCCSAYTTALANAKASDQTDPTMQMAEFSQLFTDALAWMASGTSSAPSYQQPSEPFFPPTNAFDACMVVRCEGVDGCAHP